MALADELDNIVGDLEHVAADIGRIQDLPVEISDAVSSLCEGMRCATRDIRNAVDKMDDIASDSLLSDIDIVLNSLPDPVSETWDQTQVRRAAERIKDVIFSLEDLLEAL